MTEEFKAQAMDMMKTRMDRLTIDDARVRYFQARLEAAAQEIENKGIVLTDSVADLLLVVDYAVWQYQNRDNPSAMPPDIHKRILKRWVPGKEDVS